jgi:hypothetical protein
VSIVEKLSEWPHMNKVALPCIIADVEPSRYGYDEPLVAARNGSEQQKQVIEQLLVGNDAPYKRFIRPEFIRLAPPLHAELDEVYFIIKHFVSF